LTSICATLPDTYYLIVDNAEKLTDSKKRLALRV